MTTTEPVDALAAMRECIADPDAGMDEAAHWAAVVQAEALTSLAADVKRIADAYVDATVDAAARLRLDAGSIARDEHEAKLILLRELKDQTERAEAAEVQCNRNADDLDALRAEVERIAGDAAMTAHMCNPEVCEGALRALTDRLRRALEGGGERG